jgi:hypothetical protein
VTRQRRKNTAAIELQGAQSHSPAKWALIPQREGDEEGRAHVAVSTLAFLFACPISCVQLPATSRRRAGSCSLAFLGDAPVLGVLVVHLIYLGLICITGPVAPEDTWAEMKDSTEEIKGRPGSRVKVYAIVALVAIAVRQ